MSKYPKKLYALKTPCGYIVPKVFDRKADVIFDSFDFIAESQGGDWQSRYWKRMVPSIMAARRAGYRAIQIRLVEVGECKSSASRSARSVRIVP